MKEEIRHYLTSQTPGGSLESLTDSESLLEAGVIDSMSMLDLITHLESTYNITVDEDEMIPENFETMDGIVSYMQEKIG